MRLRRIVLPCIILGMLVLLLAQLYPTSASSDGLSGPAGDEGTLRVTLPGEADEAGEPSRIASLTQLPSWRLEGRIEGLEKHGIGNVRLMLRSDIHYSHEDLAEGRSRKDGTYLFDLSALRERPQADLDRIKLFLQWKVARYLPGSLRIELDGPDPDKDLVLHEDISLKAGGTARGKIFSQAGKPVANALVQLRESGGKNVVASTRSTGDGSYFLGIENEGLYDLEAIHAEHGGAGHSGLSLPGDEDFDVPDLVLTEIGRITGVVLYKDGQPITDLPISAQLNTDMMAAASPVTSAGLRRGSTKTDSAGRFEFRALRPGIYQLGTSIQSFNYRKEPLPLIETDKPELRIVLDLHRIHLVFQDRDGEEISQLDGMLRRGWPADYDRHFRDLVRGIPLSPELLSKAPMAVGYLGTQIMVPRGSWWWFSGRHKELFADALVHADPMHNESTVILRLKPVKLSALFRIQLYARPGERVKDFKIKYFDSLMPGQPGEYEFVNENEQGKLYRAPPGQFHVELQPEPRTGFSPIRSNFFRVNKQIHVVAGKETQLDLLAPQGGRIRMTVHLPENREVKAINGFRAKLLISESTPKRLGLDPFRVVYKDRKGWGGEHNPPSESPFTCWPLLEAGKYTIAVSAQGYETRTLPVLIQSGKDTEVEVYLRAKH